MSVAARSIGASLDRVEGREKVAGEAVYAYEHSPEGVVYAAIVQSTVAKGRMLSVDASAALALTGVLGVLSHENVPRLEEQEGELAVLQSDRVAYRGQIVAAVVAETLETARHAERLVRVEYEQEEHDVELRADHPRLYKPDKVNPTYDTDTDVGDVDTALASARVTVDVTYETPSFHNNPMEPHAAVAVWDGNGGLTVYDTTQGSSPARETIARVFGLAEERVRVVAPHVGGGFGSKGNVRPQAVLAALAAQVVGRPVKAAVTRRQMFDLTGYRTPIVQRLRLGADVEGHLTAIVHDVVEQTSTVQEFAEQTAVVTRMMYAAPNRRTTHRLVALDVPTPSWMRAPGECPGMYALESALDELALAAGVDPIELRVRNEPARDPESGLPFSSRGLVACLREGAERFGWSRREPQRDGPWLHGRGVAASTYPARRRPSEAVARRVDGGFVVQVAANDIGTGARTALTQIAADALEVEPARVRVEVGDSAFGKAPVAGGSAGTASWGTAVHLACRRLVEDGGDEVRVDSSDDVESQEPYSRHAFGAQFVEVRVNAETGEIRVPRVLGVFAAGTIVNPKTARSQFVGGMTMGLGMALLEEGILDPRFGDVVNDDLATYHVPVYADVEEIEAVWIDEDDPHLNPVGVKGIGEIGIVGTAAAVTNAVHDATGVRFRRLPIRLDQVVEALA
ncbi:MAG TPA: xanthine dehydrogenase family protein molybdopterin-binding subunit [Gaiellaceae bacterium]|nr:xanthine dehydrogenase family protein molybdopterin-binding subunit [Gaiellaceae bacterium]